MVLGLSLPAFTLVHVIISLIGIAAGLVVMFGLLGSKPMPRLTTIFLAFTILTSATGFLFPRSRSCCRRISSASSRWSCSRSPASRSTA
ncbi:hypothetical protein ACVWZV_002401 [Bradyrhizobium sp. GM5.1]